MGEVFDARDHAAKNHVKQCAGANSYHVVHGVVQEFQVFCGQDDCWCDGDKYQHVDPLHG